MLKDKTINKEKNDNPITINLSDSYMSQLIKIAELEGLPVAAIGRKLLQKILIDEYAKLQSSAELTKPIFKLN